MGRPIKRGKKWQIRWFDEHGVRRSEEHKKYQDAVQALQVHWQEVQQAKARKAHPEPIVRTFNELADYWLEHRASKKRSQKDDQSVIRAHLRPAFGTLTLSEVTVEKVDKFVAERGHLSPKTIHNHLTLVISMLNLALELSWIAKAPRIRKPHIHLLPEEFHYLKSDDEIRRLLTAAKEEGEEVFIFYAIAIYTGMRAGEIAGLLWEMVNFANRIITVQRSYENPTKSGKVRYIPILDPLLPILKEWRLKNQNRLVCPNNVGEMHDPSARIFQEIYHRCLGKAELGHLRFHDLRHTFASHWVLHEGDIFRLQNILGHSSITMTQRYAHLAPDVFAADYARLGRTIPVSNAEIIPLRAAETAN